MRLIYRKSIALALAGSLAFSAVPSFADSQAKMKKVETVYVNLTAEGKERQVIDSTWIKNSQFYPEVEDCTILNDILSVSASTLESNKDDKQVWKTNGEDIYYQAEIDKTLPIDVDIEYILDGKKLTPEEIAGKSGKLELKIKLRNRNYTGKLTTPFTAVGVIPLATDVFSNVEMENGKFYSDGTTQTAVFIGFPSMNDMLELKNEAFEPLKTLDFPDEFTLTADVKEFELETIGIAISPEIPDMIKEMEGEEDIEEDLEDIREVRDAKDKFEAADPNDRLKDLIRVDDKVNRSRQLVDDLFKFYDLDTAIIEEMPAYVTDENIALFDRVKADMKKYKVADLLDNEVLRSIPKRMNEMNIARARMMLDWHDVFQEFDESRLDKLDEVIDDRKVLIDFMNDVDEIVDDVRAHEDELDELSGMLRRAKKIKNIFNDIDLKTVTAGLSQSDIDVMVEALTKKKTEEALAEYAAVLPPAGQLTPEQQAQLGAILQKFASESAVDPQMVEQAKGIIASGYFPEELREKMEMMLTAKIKQEVEAQVNAKLNYGESILNELRALNHEMRIEYGSDYMDKLKDHVNYIKGLKDDLDTLDAEEKQIDDKIQKAKDVFESEEDIAYFKSWKSKIQRAREDIDANEENIQIMRDLLDQYDKPDIKELYDNFDVILNDLDEVRPIAESFNDMMDKPANDRALHDMPNTLPVLIQLRRDIFKNRDISEDLRLATSDDVVDAAKTMIDLMDKKDNETSLDDIEEQLESAQNIIDKKDELLALSDKYNNFAGKQSDIESSVQFILKTDEIKKPEPENNDIEVREEKAPSFFEWLGSLFS